jgi:hypothetical protein
LGMQRRDAGDEDQEQRDGEAFHGWQHGECLAGGAGEGSGLLLWCGSEARIASAERQEVAWLPVSEVYSAHA